VNKLPPLLRLAGIDGEVEVLPGSFAPPFHAAILQLLALALRVETRPVSFPLLFWFLLQIRGVILPFGLGRVV